MGECQARQRLVFVCKFCQLVDGVDQLPADLLQGLGHDDYVGVVADIT